MCIYQVEINSRKMFICTLLKRSRFRSQNTTKFNDLRRTELCRVFAFSLSRISTSLLWLRGIQLKSNVFADRNLCHFAMRKSKLISLSLFILACDTNNDRCKVVLNGLFSSDLVNDSSACRAPRWRRRLRTYARAEMGWNKNTERREPLDN